MNIKEIYDVIRKNTNITHSVINYEDITFVEEFLDIKNLSNEELQELRNEIVKYWGDSIDRIDDSEGSSYCIMSGVTAVIDNELFNRSKFSSVNIKNIIDSEIERFKEALDKLA